jgi:hypothetical protein
VAGGWRSLVEGAAEGEDTELGAVTLIGLTTGCEEMARLIGASSIDTPLASWSSTSFFSEMESRYSIILVFRLAHRSWVMQRPASVAHAVFLAAAAGGVDGLVHRDDDVGHGDLAALRPSE